jgi:predicted phosphodiesterase
VRLGVVADVHGNAAALRAVMADAGALDVDAWWALGDLVLFGPRPVEVLELLASLPNVDYVGGNTDRYVVMGEQPSPHATAADAAGDLDLVERYGAMAGAIGWTRGALSQAGMLDALHRLPSQQRATLADGSLLLGVHASPGRDDGIGISTRCPDDALSALLAGCGAAVVVGGHTHDPTDRMIDRIRALNPGSVGLPRQAGQASWMLIDTHLSPVRVAHRQVAFDVEAVVGDLHSRGYPNASFVESVLDGRRVFSG